MSVEGLLKLYQEKGGGVSGDFPSQVLCHLIDALKAQGARLLWNGSVVAESGQWKQSARWYPLPAGLEKLQIALEGGEEPRAELLSAAGVVLSVWLLRQELRQARFRERRRLWEVEGLKAMAEVLGGTLDWEAVAQSLLFHSMALLDARRGEVWLAPGLPWPGITESPLQSGFTLVSRIGGEVLGPAQMASLEGEGMVSEEMIAVPIRCRSRVLGALALAEREVRGGVAPFSQQDRETLSLLAMQAGLALEAILALASRLEQERMENELALAASVQRHLLPVLPRALPGWELASFFAPSRQVGGDLYDLVATSNATVVALFDVAGKGAAAALLAASLQGALRVAASYASDLEALANHLDRHLGSLWAAHQFATAFFWQLTQGGEVTYLGAGHTPAVVVGPSGVRVIPPQNPPLGLLERARFCGERLSLIAGETVVLATDGIVEAENSRGEQFGLERLCQLVLAKRDMTLEDLVAAIAAAVQEHVGGAPAQDDQTLVAFRKSS